MKYDEDLARENGYDVLINIFGEKVMLFNEDDDYIDESDILTEAKNPFKSANDGDVYKCYFPKLKRHQHRYGVIVKIPGLEPRVMILGSTEGKDWQQYDANKLLNDWKVEGLKKKTFAYTDALIPPNDVVIKSRSGSLTRADYDRIVKPIADNINEKHMQKLLSGESFDDIYKKIL